MTTSMLRRRHGLRTFIEGASAALLVAAGLIAAGPASALAATCSVRCFTATVSPTDFTAGSSVLFTMALTPRASVGSNRLGSANITAPAGVTVTHVNPPATGSATVVGGVVQLRDLAIDPPASGSVTFSADTAATAGSYAFAVAARSSRDYARTAAGNDLTLDTAASQLTVTADPGPGTCPADDVSCGQNFTDYNKPSTVSTGVAPNVVTWLVGTISFPATGSPGGQYYRMDAPVVPGAFCPLPGPGPVSQCTFEMDIDIVPAAYAGHPVTLVLVCHSSHCPSTPSLLVKQQAGGQTMLILPCFLTLPGTLCFDAARDAANNLRITLRNIKPGDPKIAG